MSVQLILFPQNYEGGFNAISGDPNEKIVNGIAFAGMSLASSYSTTSPFKSANGINLIPYAPASIPNTWYRWRYGASGVYGALPTVSGGNLVLNLLGGAFGTSRTGVYQKITNLTVGVNYRVRIRFGSFPVGRVRVDWINSVSANALVQSNNYYPGTTNTYPLLFTAQSSSLVFFIWATNDGGAAGDIIIEKVSVIAVSQTPSQAINLLGNGQVICDLYEDEDLPLTLSVDEFKNVAEQVKSYTKAFMLPGTKKNNQIFENLFEVTRSAAGSGGLVFNPYAKTQCILKQDGFVLFEGFLKVIDIQDKKEEISYNVNLYSEVITLNDTLKDAEFNELDFSELMHDYDKSKIKGSWNTNGLELSNNLPVGSFAGTAGQKFTDVLKYPFVDWNHQIPFAYNPSGGAGPNNGMPQLPSLENVFRPFIKIKYLIDRIFEATPFSYTSDFFNTADFKDLFMDFNWGSENFPPVTGSGPSYTGSSPLADTYATTSFTNLNLINNYAWNYILPPNYNSATNVLTATTAGETYVINYNFPLAIASSYTVTLQWVHTPLASPTNPNYSHQTTFTNSGLGAYYNYQGSITVVMDAGDTLEAQFKSSSASPVVYQLGSYASTVNFASGLTSVTTNSLLQSLRGETNQWEFLKGIFTMFNLISYPDKSNPTNIIIEPYKDIFLSNNNPASLNFFDTNSTALDWTDKIDISEIKLMPLTNLKKTTIFKFVEDSDDWAFNYIKVNTQNHLYGSQLFDATLTTGGLQSILEGEEEIIANPFAATVPKQFDTLSNEIIVPSIYSYNPDDDTSEGFENSPRIMYNNGKVTMSKDSYYIPAQNGGSSENTNQYLQFTHLTEIPTVPSSTDFHFGQCQLMQGVGNAPVDNLFNTYWLPYLNELYNPDTRIMTLKVDLSPGDINTFNFYDTVFIKNREFRVNKIDYKPNDLSIVEFILLI
tara:strand:+ start:5202 stop:8018 length:2817 start_codon:yes stop_codon:yes gene_type:complete